MRYYVGMLAYRLNHMASLVPFYNDSCDKDYHSCGGQAILCLRRHHSGHYFHHHKAELINCRSWENSLIPQM